MSHLSRRAESVARELDQGLILNTNGFSGSIEVKQSTFEGNIAYVQEILLHESLETKEFYEFDDKAMILDFSDKDGKYIKFKICEKNLWSARHFFQEVIHPEKEWNDDLAVSTVENVAPFMIKGNQGPIIFKDNVFNGNIGTTGGVIHIEDPDFRYADRGKNPYIVLKENKFKKNMAYWAGNAFHISLTIRMVQAANTFSKIPSDAWQTCGAGILIDDNIFEGNLGLKKHNGGAGVIRCRHSIKEASDTFSFLSGKQRAVTYIEQTNSKNENSSININSLDNPSTTKTSILDYDQEVYELLMYGTLIVNNTFSNNFSGKRGSALLIELVNELQVIGNQFMSNGPVHTYREIEYSPYVKNFMKNNRTLAYYLLDTSFGNCIDESAWFGKCYRQGYQIDMPQIQGALYVKNCYSLATCWSAKNDPFDINKLNYSTYVNYYKPWQRMEISMNSFKDNQANIVMLKSQTQPQSTSLFIFGGTTNIIKGNEFTGHRNWANAYMKLFAHDIHQYMPKDYFSYSQAAMIRVEYPYENLAYTLTKGAALGQKAIDTVIIQNKIIDNLNIQVVTYKNLRYKASLLEYDCHVRNATLSIKNNLITRNQFIGEDSTFFYINGGIVEVSKNEISYNGLLTSQTIVNYVGREKRQYMRSSFPWDSYSFTLAQEKGIFSFDFDNYGMPALKSHNITNNVFKHIYCQSGCAYYVSGKQIQQFSFTNNVYNIMVSGKGAAVFHGDVNLPPSKPLDQVWIQSYRNETFERIWGGSIQLSGNNVPATIIKDSRFINNFGSFGAAISFNQGGALYISDSEFILKYTNDKIKAALNQNSDQPASNLQPYLQKLFAQLMQDIFTTYNDRLSQSFLFSKEVFAENISGIVNKRGQIYLKNSAKTLRNDKQPVFAFESMQLNEFVQREFQFAIKETEMSAIKDTLFQGNIGEQASAIYLESSKLKLIGTNDESKFSNNISMLGSTIFATFSIIQSTRTGFFQNWGSQGGCYQLDSNTSLTDSHSIYKKNKATYGGVFYAINDSKLLLSTSSFLQNVATDGAVLYGMYNSNERALSFKECTFNNNFADQNLMQLMSSKLFIQDSVFLDNSATFVNHGITMITSTTEFYNSTVSFSEDFAESLDLTQLDCGFFSLFLSSKLIVAKKSIIRNLMAQNQAVLSAFSLSSVHVSDDVLFLNNKVTSMTGVTIYLENTKTVQIQDAHFQGNAQTNIHIELGVMTVSNCTFTIAGQNIIYGVNSVVQLDKVLMFNSSSDEPGHGLLCIHCSYVTVDNSHFENLISGSQAGAISILSLYNKTMHPVSYIRNSSFIGNSAQKRGGGAILLDRPYMIEISGNLFQKNSAIDKVQGDGGAILYKCNPTEISYNCTVSLIDNRFIGNFAARKGGALRYENTNFTEDRLIKIQEIDSVRMLKSGSNYFEDNMALYGSDLASFPKEIRYIIPENESGAQIKDDDKKILLAPGQNFKMELQVIDQEGRLYIDENQAIAKLIFVSGQDLGSKALMLGTDSVAKDGQFVFSSLKVRIKPKTSANITIQFQGIPTYGTPIGFLDNFPVVTITARDCVQGEQYTEELSCKPCPAQFYLYDVQTSPGLCKDCSPYAFCYGMNNTAPKPGYWRSGPTLETFTPCFRPEVCLGGSEKDPLGSCSTGYQGILCADCAPGYSRSGTECNQCPAQVWNFFIFGALLIALLVVMIFLVRSTLGGIEVRKPLYQVYLKIFLNHLQILAVIAQINFKWPTLIQSVLNAQQEIAESPTGILSLDCLVMDFFPDQKPTLRLNYVRLIMFSLMPFISFLGSISFWQIYGRCKRIQPEERSNKAVATTTIVLFLFYPTIVSILAKSMNCVKIENESRLYDDLEEVCYQGTHLLMVLTVSVPGLLAWAAGIPIYALAKLFHNVGHLEKIKKFTEGKGTQHDELRRSFKVRLGFLTAGYADKYFYWEIVLLMRKTLLVLMIVFMSSVSSGVQSLSVISILTVFFIIQVRLQPYYDPSLNRMETLSLFVIILTIYFGLYYQAGEGDSLMTSKTVTWVMFFCVIIPTVIFAFNFFRIMWTEVLKLAARKSAKIFRLLTCGTKDLIAFRALHLAQAHEEKSEDEDRELKEIPKKEEDLVGFTSKEDEFSFAVKKRIDSRRKLLFNRKNEERQLESVDLNRILKKPSPRPLFPNIFKIGQDQASKKDSRTSQSIILNSELSSQQSLEDPYKPNMRNLLKYHKQSQNFEYREEIEFRGENTAELSSQTIKILTKEKDHQDGVFAPQEIVEEITQPLKKPKLSNTKPEDHQILTSQFDDLKLMVVNEDDFDFLQGRSEQQQIKRQFKQAVGVTQMLDLKADKRKQLYLLKPHPSCLQKDESNSLQQDPVSTLILPSDRKDSRRSTSLQRTSLPSRFTQRSKPAPTKEEILKKPRKLFSQKRDPRGTVAIDSLSKVSPSVPKFENVSSPSVSFLKDSNRENDNDVDFDSFYDEEGKAVGTIRGNTSRTEKAVNWSSKLKNPGTLKLKLRRKPTVWQDEENISHFDEEMKTNQQGGTVLPSKRGESQRKRAVLFDIRPSKQVKTLRESKSMKSSPEHVKDDLLSDEEGSRVVQTIRGNSQRKQVVPQAAPQKVAAPKFNSYKKELDFDIDIDNFLKNKRSRTRIKQFKKNKVKSSPDLHKSPRPEFLLKQTTSVIDDVLRRKSKIENYKLSKQLTVFLETNSKNKKKVKKQELSSSD